MDTSGAGAEERRSAAAATADLADEEVHRHRQLPETDHDAHAAEEEEEGDEAGNEAKATAPAGGGESGVASEAEQDDDEEGDEAPDADGDAEEEEDEDDEEAEAEDGMEDGEDVTGTDEEDEEEDEEEEEDRVYPLPPLPPVHAPPKVHGIATVEVYSILKELRRQMDDPTEREHARTMLQGDTDVLLAVAQVLQEAHLLRRATVNDHGGVEEQLVPQPAAPRPSLPTGYNSWIVETPANMRR